MTSTPVKAEQAAGATVSTRRRGFALPKLAWLIVEFLPRTVGLMLLWAASLKLWDSTAIVQVLQFNRLHPSLIGITVTAVIIIEIVLGLAMVLKPRVKWALDSAVMLLAFYTLQLAWLASSAEAPGCECLFAWEAYHSARFSNLMGIGRNICLILPLLWVRSRVCGTGYQPVMSKDTGW